MMFTVLVAILVLDAIALIVAVLLQAGQGGGLAALGGGASTDSFFGGRQATTILTKASWWGGGIFLAICLLLSIMVTRAGLPTSVLDGQIQAPPPVSAAAPLIEPTQPQPAAVPDSN